jgi:hypothetical protein
VKCFQCGDEAIGVCRWCLLGQCETHMRESLEGKGRLYIMGCTHMFNGQSVRPVEGAGRGGGRTQPRS